MKIIFSIIIILMVNTGFTQSIPADRFYLGQTTPKDSAIVFAPGLITFA